MLGFESGTSLVASHSANHWSMMTWFWVVIELFTVLCTFHVFFVFLFSLQMFSCCVSLCIHWKNIFKSQWLDIKSQNKKHENLFIKQRGCCNDKRKVYYKKYEKPRKDLFSFIPKILIKNFAFWNDRNLQLCFYIE